MADPPAGPSRITHGAITVLAHLHETDATCREVTRNTGLSESSTYRWLTELADAGLLETEAMERSGRPVMLYHLPDDDLGAAAQVLVDRLGRTGSSE